MNHDNKDRLIKRLQTVDPNQFFDYWNASARFCGDPVSSDAGCVACHVRYLTGVSEDNRYDCRGINDIQDFLDIPRVDAEFLYVPGGGAARGLEGIRNAIRRIELVAAKYPREVVPDDAAFLAQCRVAAKAPALDLVLNLDQQNMDDYMKLAVRAFRRRLESR